MSRENVYECGLLTTQCLVHNYAKNHDSKSILIEIYSPGFCTKRLT